MPLIEVFSQLEENYPIRFFYDPAWVDSISVSLEAEGLNLEEFLDKLIDGTDLEYHLEKSGRIIFTKGHKIVKLPENFFKEEIPEEPKRITYSIFDKKEDPELLRSVPDVESREFTIGDQPNASGEATISGYIRMSSTGEPLIGASVFITSPFVGATTNAFGYYMLTLPQGNYRLHFKSVGMVETTRKINLRGDGQFDLKMDEDIIPLDEIVVQGELNIINSIQTGRITLDQVTIKTMPTILGEIDIMKISLTLPGVQTVGEGASGFNVRGGATDQNLILLDDVVVYNPSHLFGFFSAFNPDAIKGAGLYKSSIQADYGGRISSVLDIAIREGSKKKLNVSGGISPVSAKVTIDGPLKKDTTSFLLGIRSTYSDWLLEELNDDPELKNSSAFFGDVIGKIHHQANNNNSFTLSGYHSQDRFVLNDDTVYRYSNTNVMCKWRKTINHRLFSTVSLGFTEYNYKISNETSPANAFELNYGIQNSTFKGSFDWLPNANHGIKFGLNTTLYRLNPGSIKPIGGESIVDPRILNEEKGLETALYLGDEYKYNDRLSIYAGLRFSHFGLLGPGRQFKYLPGFSRETQFITDTVSFGKGSLIKAYSGPEYRFSSRYKLRNQSSIKFSYDRTQQFIHQLTNTTAVSPTDTWRLSNAFVKPQIGDQYSVGWYRTFPAYGINISVEGYYKKVRNLLEYKSGADLLVNEVLETDVINARGKSYGMEVFFRKKSGKLNGWISYTYSRALVKALGPFKVEQINQGEFFPANFDKPHNLAVVTNYKFNRRINMSTNIVYTSGRPVTFPIATYQFRGNTYSHFPERNQLRIPDYFRLDYSVNIEGNHKIKKPFHGSWSFSIYNLTGRNNAYSIFARTEDGKVQVFQLSVFAEPIPTLTYNFRF